MNYKRLTNDKIKGLVTWLQGVNLLYGFNHSPQLLGMLTNHPLTLTTTYSVVTELQPICKYVATM